MSDLETGFDECLDQNYAEVEVFGKKYAPSLVLKNVDPETYNVGLRDYVVMLEVEADGK
jgi:hypothetical protein